MNARVRKVWSLETFDRALWCLDEQRISIQAMLARFAAADANTVEKALNAAFTLTSPQSCVDADRLQARPAPPMRRRAAIRETLTELSGVANLDLLADPTQAVDLLTNIHERAMRLKWPPLIVAARHAQGRTLDLANDFVGAEQALTDAFFMASEQRSWAVAADASTELAGTLAEDAGRSKEGLLWAQIANMAISLAGDPENLREAARLQNLARVRESMEAYPAARDLLERALALRARALGPDHPAVARILNNLGKVNYQAGAFTEAVAQLERAMAIKERTYGSLHPIVARSMNNLGAVYAQNGRLAEARALFTRALAILEQALGPHNLEVAASANNLAIFYRQEGSYAMARELHERALTIERMALSASDSRIVESLENLGMVQMDMGDHRGARKTFEQAQSICPSAHPLDAAACTRTMSLLADFHMRMGSFEMAESIYEEVMSIHKRSFSADGPRVALAIAGLAEVHRRADRPKQAIPLLERACRIYARHEGAQAGESAAHFALAQALDAVGGAPARAIAHAEEARAFADDAVEVTAKDLAEIDAWLAEHRPTNAPALRSTR